MHLQVLALGLKLLMTRFVRSVLFFYRVILSQLSAVVWHTILGFETLSALYTPEACQCEVFSMTYALLRTLQDARYFFLQSGVDKISSIFFDSDHGMRDIVIRVSNL